MQLSVAAAYLIIKVIQLNPNEMLGRFITTKLAEDKLISENDKKKVAEDISSGNLSEADWRMFLEKNIPVTKLSSNEA